ncbi:MAG TPA: glycosyltransferase [Thermoleophilaceae bacterium]
MNGSGSRTCGVDGVICFGGVDWWYHNRGHYDVQMMRELSADRPVLYVNSIGMRMPTPHAGGMFHRRVARKLRSVSRGLVIVRPNFAVLSGLALPGRLGGLSRRRALPFQVQRAARALGIRRPLVWVAVPTAAEALDSLPAEALVYQRTDRFESFAGVDGPRIEALDRGLKRRADLTLFCSTLLYEEERADCRHAMFVDHGVDYERFAAAGRGELPEPGDTRSLPRPRVGFVGSIEPHTLDPKLVVEVAQLLPNVHFVLVGESTLPKETFALPNVSLLGKRPYERVAAYMAACDVLIMPWTRSPWIEACNPVKLKEYLAVGRPIVTTPFRELERYAEHVRVASDAPSFVRAVEESLARPGDAAAGRARVRRDSWSQRADAVLGELGRSGIAIAGTRAGQREH